MNHIGSYNGVKIFSLGDYYSKKKFPNEHANHPHSKLLIEFKNGESNAVTYMASLVKNSLLNSTLKERRFYISTVPSSTAGRASPGLTQLIMTLSRDFSIINQGNLLYRTASKTPAHLGGSRDKNVLLETLAIGPKFSSGLDGAPVLLLDDVTTTTSSFQAAIDTLQFAKAEIPAAIALAKTVQLIS